MRLTYVYVASRRNLSNLLSSLRNQSSLKPTSRDVPDIVNNVPTTSSFLPINFERQSYIQGEESQILQIELLPNQSIRAESGAMLYMSEGVEMDTNLGGDVKGSFKRYLTGQSLFISDYTYKGPSKGFLALGTDFPSKILRLNLCDFENELICQRGAFMASSISDDVQIKPQFTKTFTAGFFGGEGFILQSITGKGDVFVKASGALVKKHLNEGETLRVSSGCIVAFTKQIDYDVTTMPGFKNVVFGGEGLFITTLKGPGVVWLQGMPPDKMISEIVRRVPSGSGIGLGIPIGMGSGESVGSDDDDDTLNDTDMEKDETESSADDSEMDRDVAFASSESQIDSESPSALFGDVSAKEDNRIPTDESRQSDISDFDSPTNISFDDEDIDFNNDFSEERSDDEFGNGSEDTFSTEDKFSSYEPAQDNRFDTEADDEASISSILRSVWDMFNDDD